VRYGIDLSPRKGEGTIVAALSEADMRVVATAFDPYHKPTRVFRKDMPKTLPFEPYDRRLEIVRDAIRLVSDQVLHSLKRDHEDFYVIEIAVSP
jgi:hypothetical protein